MDPERWRQVETLYHATLARPAGERSAFLAEACAVDEWLRREVQSLLDQSGSGHRAFEGGALAMAAKGFPPSASGSSLIGRRIGSYEVTAHLGAGGMGEVFRAHDTTLGRDVAIKVLPRNFTSDPDRLSRFEREARMLAALNHPHIGAIYGVEQSEGVPALILELVEGPTLADRLATGPIPLTQALGIGSQIVDALDAAHERGIVHRDLKPGNIKITPAGTVKVLDFGLAKSAASGGDLSHSLAAGAGGTREGVILGTPSYMSPEQARGLAVDRRTDIWAFGCVLYEMLTGRTGFPGATASDTMAAILEREPDWNALPPTTPAPVRRLLRRCLEKDRARRLADIADVRLEIDDALAAPAAETSALTTPPARRGAPVPIVALAGGTVIAALVTWAVARPVPPMPVRSSRFAIVPSLGRPLNSSGADRDVAISPDGRYFVYLGGGGFGAGGALMVRATDQLDAHQLPASGRAVFSSPDSRWIGFFAGAEIKKVSITGGAAITLGPAIGGALGASWGDDNTIVFATSDPSTGLWRVSADGGEPTVLTTPDAARNENDHAFPSVLPGGRGVLFTITGGGQADNSQVAVLDLRTGQRKTLVRGGSQPGYVDSSAGTGEAGYLIYAAAGTLRAVRFDSDRLEVLGDPVTVVESVMIKPTGAANYAVSQKGTLFYVSGGASVQMTPRSLVWVDRMGHEEPIEAPIRGYVVPRVSPDGTRLALVVPDQGGSNLWIWDLARKTLRRLTFGPGIDGLPVWTRDGRRIVFTSDRTGVFNLYSQAVDGTGAVDRLTTTTNPQYPTSITPDGRLVIVEAVATPAASGVNRVRLFHLPSPEGERRPGSSPDESLSVALSLGQTLFDGNWPEFSPDGRYLAYQSDGPGRPEVYVRPFPQVDSGRWQISTTGGTRPAWSRSGDELFYLDASNTLTAVPVQTSGSTFNAGTPAKVFDAKYATPFPPRQYDLSPDGQGFLMMKDSAPDDPNATSASMVVVERWFEELKRLVPTN